MKVKDSRYKLFTLRKEQTVEYDMLRGWYKQKGNCFAGEKVNKQKGYSMPFSQKTVSTIFCFSILFWPSRHERTLEQEIRNTLSSKC